MQLKGDIENIPKYLKREIVQWTNKKPVNSNLPRITIH